MPPLPSCDTNVLSRLKDPEPKLASAANAARNALANKLSGIALASLLKDLLSVLAPRMLTMHREDMQ